MPGRRLPAAAAAVGVVVVHGEHGPFTRLGLKTSSAGDARGDSGGRGRFVEQVAVGRVLVPSLVSGREGPESLVGG